MAGTSSVQLSDIQLFYKDSTVFLTGATGFVGKLYLEKVLRALPIKKIFILVRPKKDVPASKRFNDILQSQVFDLLRKTNPDVLKKIFIVEGDCSLPLLGLNEEGRKLFVDEVDVVFHCAATVRFDEEIGKATKTNVRATKDLVELAKQCNKIKTFVYVGTAFSNSNREKIREEVYPPNILAENLVTACECLDSDLFSSMKNTFLAGWPNTYTFTKQVTEDYISREARSLPICIARPTIVTSTAAEPMVAFVDSFFTLAGFILTYALGINRITYSRNVNIDMVPADYVINQCIAAGWQTGVNFKGNQTNVPVYNISSSTDNPITQDEAYNIIDYYCRENVTPKLLTYPIYFRTSCKYNYLFWRFFFHTLPGYVMDLLMRLQGKKPKYAEGFAKLHAFQESYEYFTTNNFFFYVENTHKLLKRMTYQDKQLFNFDMCTLNWEMYFSQYVRGFRVYLLKDPLETIADGVKRYRYLKKVMIVTMVLLTILLYVLGKIFLFRFVPLVFRGLLVILRYIVN